MRGDETDAISGLFGIHIGMEIRQGGVSPFRVGAFPFGKQADGEAAEHTQYPNAVLVADPAQVFVGRNVQSLMQGILDAPILPAGLEPLCRVEPLRFATCELKDRFGRMLSEVAVYPCDLYDVGEANRLGVGRGRENLPSFPSALICLVAEGLLRRRGAWGGNPPEGR